MSRLRLDDIENSIEALTGTPVGPLKLTDTRKITQVSENVRFLLREWLETQGVAEHKIPKSDNGLANAYHAGRDWVQRRLIDGDTFGSEARQVSRRMRNAIELSFDEDTNSLLDDKPKTNTDEITFDSLSQVATSTPASAPNSDLEYEINTQRVERAIATSVNAAQSRLASQLSSAVAVETRKQLDMLGLGIKLTTDIQSLAEATATRIISELAPRRVEIKLPNKPIRLLSDEPRHEKFDQALRYLSRRRHVYAVGPAGTGKTKLAEQLADAMETKFYPITPALTKYDWSGYNSATGEYIGTLLREAMENGGFALIDEGDTCAAAALMFLNPALANGYGTFPDKVIRVHPDFRCMICANTYGRGADRQYVGRNPLDAASRNRFVFVEINYDRKLEAQLFGTGPWVQYCWRVRDAIEKLHLQHVCSMRNIELCVEGAECGDDPEEIMQSSLWQGLEPDTIAKIKSIAGDMTRNIREVA